jgi:hypothetical protein
MHPPGSTPAAVAGPIQPLRRAAWVAAVTYILSTAIVALGAAFGLGFVTRADRASPPNNELSDFIRACVAWDGAWYRIVMLDGYSYNPERHSSVNFFPAYPVLASGVRAATGLMPEAALLLTSNLLLACAMALFYAYCLDRMGDGRSEAQLALACLALVPTGFFFRMAYTESFLLAVAAGVLWGIRRGWPPAAVAAVVGLGTATRAVGVGLLAPLAVYLLSRPVPLRRKALEAAVCLPLALWGIGGFIGYCWWRFGEPLAFTKAVVHWHLRAPLPLIEQLWALETLKPMREILDRTSPYYWRNMCQADGDYIFFSLYLANPFYFLLFAGLLLLGAWQYWLNRYELVLGAALLAIPYATNCYEVLMLSSARYAAVALPVYMVLGRLVSRLPPAVTAAFLGFCAFFLGVYAALFVRGCWFT